MSIGYATVKAKGQIVIPVDLRRRFQIEEGTRVAFLEQEGKLILQPVTDDFINGMQASCLAKACRHESSIPLTGS
jgi:AbrB family looped-hinge helix DNA binding protein